MSKTKLELTWIGKDKRPKLEPRILLEDPSLSYHAKHRVSENDQFDNKLIYGDNLLALKALEQEYAGTVKCVFIDPPYEIIPEVAPKLFARLTEVLAAKPEALVVFEAPGEIELAPPGWTLRKRLGKGRGQPTVMFFRRDV